jgi:hypothetical protein
MRLKYYFYEDSRRAESRFKSSRAHHRKQNAIRTIMKQLLLAGLVGAVLLAGCASRYVIALKDGQRIVAVGKPQLEGFNFVYTDLSGRTNSLPSSRVRAIVSVSSAPPAK